MFDWDEYRKLAEELRERDDEVAQRTAISRVYYAVYWRARTLLQDEGFIFREFEPSHRQVWQEYKNKGRTFHAISIAGTDLHKKRVQADYVAEIENIKTMVSDSFKLA